MTIADREWMKQDGSRLGIVRESDEGLEAVAVVVGIFP